MNARDFPVLGAIAIDNIGVTETLKRILRDVVICVQKKVA
jgi:hypothetical protein